jgi:hypothetical protein
MASVPALKLRRYLELEPIPTHQPHPERAEAHRDQRALRAAATSLSDARADLRAGGYALADSED